MAATEPITNRLTAVNDASGRAFALWVTFLTVAVYLAIAIGTTTHLQLLLEMPVKLPLLGVDLSLFAFYEFAPPLFLVLHLYVLMQLYFLSRLLHSFGEDLQRAQMIERDRERVRDQLDTFVFTQLAIGAPENWLVRQFLRLSVWLTFLIAPVLLVLAFQLQFLPYHSTAITWTHRVVLLLDITLLWALWTRMPLAGIRPGRPATMARYAVRTVLVLACVLLVAFSVCVATLPTELIETWEVTAGWPIRAAYHDVFKTGRVVWWPTWVLFEGEPSRVLSRTSSIFSRNLVLIDAQLVEPDSDKLAKLTRTIALRGRDLRFAELGGADLRKADLTGAELQGASLTGAHLQGASLDDAHLQGAILIGAHLQGASLNDAHLQGVRLDHAHLQGASLHSAHLQGASLDEAELQDTSLDHADLQGASLTAELQGASLYYADLQGASLVGAYLQGAILTGAELQGASLTGAHLQGASLDDAHLQGASLDGADLQGASLNDAHLQGASLNGADLQGASLDDALYWRALLEASTVDLVDARKLDLGPMSAPEISKLIDDVKAKVPVGEAQTDALQRLSILQEDMPAEKEQALEAPWRELSERGWNTDADDPKLATFLASLTCGAASNIHVAHGLVSRLGGIWHPPERPYASILARALRDPSCVGALDLRPDEKDALDEIIKESHATKPAPPNASAAAVGEGRPQDRR
jgi:uncharacterized protein YjbI with pentapeptide repeats